MVVSQKMFNELVTKVNEAFEKLEKRIEELESKNKTTPRKAPIDKSK
jgi:BMFP domain-containing protein YqiC